MLTDVIKQKLNSNFYLKEVNIVAKNLLGKLFVRQTESTKLVAKIVEVEAYSSTNDQASHSFNGITGRNKSMFLEGGHLYVYFIYGVHYCANVVTGKPNDGNAVLIRAVEPLNNLEALNKNRFGTNKTSNKLNLTNGPAKFCKAFSIDKNDDGKSLLGDEVFIASNTNNEKFEIVKSKRIGISKSVDLQWRYFIKGNPFVSKK